MSFFDDDEPPTRAARPRRPTEGRPRTATTGTRARSAPPGGGGGDQQLMVRRAVALGIGALILILLVVGIKGCLSSRANNALKDYNRNVSAIVTDSNEQVSNRLFDLLAGGQSSQPLDLQQNVNQVRVQAEEDVKRARALDVPGDMQDAQWHLLEVLTLRAGAVEKIADLLPDLGGDQDEQAADNIAGEMSALLASDVVYAARVIPFIQQTLADHDISGQTITPSRFLPDTQWLDPGFVRQKLTGKGGGRRPGGPPAPGTHGHGLISVSVGGVTLDPENLNHVEVGSNPTFTVTFQNQGENDEFDVGVRVAVQGAGKPVTKRIDQTTHGSGNLDVQVPLGTTPPLNTPTQVTVTILPVPGEVNTDNNTQTYPVVFSG